MATGCEFRVIPRCCLTSPLLTVVSVQAEYDPDVIVRDQHKFCIEVRCVITFSRIEENMYADPVVIDRTLSS